MTQLYINTSLYLHKREHLLQTTIIVLKKRLDFVYTKKYIPKDKFLFLVLDALKYIYKVACQCYIEIPK